MTGPWSKEKEVVEEPAFQPERMKVDGEGVFQHDGSHVARPGKRRRDSRSAAQ